MERTKTIINLQYGGGNMNGMKASLAGTVAMGMLCTACAEHSDVAELYDSDYAPGITTAEQPAQTTATSGSLHIKLTYPNKIKEVLCTVGTDPDSVKQRLGHTFAYKPFKEGATTLVMDSLMPGTHYYCNVYIRDYRDELHEGPTSEFETKSLNFSAKQGWSSYGLTFQYDNLGEHTQVGYRMGYDKDLVDAQTKLTPTMPGEVYNGSAWVEINLNGILPTIPVYLQPIVEQGGHTFRGEIMRWESPRPMPEAWAEVGRRSAKITVDGHFTYGDSEALPFKLGFYFADHPITEDNLGTRYETYISFYASETTIRNLNEGTTYYVRPYLTDGTRRVLGKEYRFDTRKGFEGEVCDIDIWPQRRDDRHYYIRFVRVEPGTFTMGATPAQVPFAEEDEYPAHDVTIDHPFYICEHEWTSGMTSVMRWWTGTESKVAARLTYSEALELIDKLNQETELKGFRLPTEAEWEYAARGGHKANGDWLYAGSDDYSEVGFLGNSVPDGNCLWGERVKTKAPNALGLYDMSGNAGEWCSDLYDPDYYTKSPETNPTGSLRGSDHVVRGGDLSPYRPETDRRVSNRWHSNDYYEIFTGKRSPLIGLRLIYDPSEDE